MTASARPPGPSHARLRLLHLVSPSLPVGAFAYSQGIEWAVEAGWLRSAAQVEDWLRDQLRRALAWTDLPLLARMRAAVLARDRAAADGWIDELLAWRETAELRAEERQRGRALADLLRALGGIATQRERDAGVAGAAALPACWWSSLARSQTAGFAAGAALWHIDAEDTLLGYAWAWLENLTLAAVKLVPLGQTQGQRLLASLLSDVPPAVATALAIEDAAIGASSPALAIASGAHETQYSRLFRS